MNEQEQTQTQQTDNGIYKTPDVYQTQTGQDVYRTSDMSAAHHDTGGMFSGEQGQNANPTYGGGQPSQDDSSQYGKQPYPNANNPYGSGQYGKGSNPYGGGQYGNPGNPYGGGQYQHDNYQYGKNPYGNNQYGNNQYNNQQYGNNQYGNPYGPNPYANNPYSPYAMPPAKNHTGLIVGIIITVVILFLIAVFALFYHVLDVATQKKEVDDIINSYDYYDNDDNDNLHEDDYGYHDNDENDNDDNNDNYSNDDDNYGYDNYYDDYYNDYDDDEYYTLHDDIKQGLSYSIEWEYYEYEPADSDVMILIDYPVVVGSHVPNLDKINELLADEITVFTEYYEEEYANYMYGEDSYFYASATGYVTYMSEDVLSVVFDEMVYSDYYDSVYCYSINIDMRDGVVLDNTDIIAVDDAFSIDFRYRSEEQNGSNSTIDWMSDQEITELLTSPGNLIIYYVPQGMEIGFNYEDGWITVTYHDYKDYLKIF